MTIQSLITHLNTCATAHHVAQYWAHELRTLGFVEFVSPSEQREEVLSKGFAIRGGSILAWRNLKSMQHDGVRIVGAHTDSPGLHLKPRQGRVAAEQKMLDVEVYGSPLLSSWADRDLCVAGRVTLRDGTTRLYRSHDPIGRISLLAIHLDREVNDRGLVLDRHAHLSMMWGQGPTSFDAWLAALLSVKSDDIQTWSGELFDYQPAALIGEGGEYVVASKLDNQVSCWAAMSALRDAEFSAPSMVALFDHEEVGSNSTTGANGPILAHILERLTYATGATRDGFLNMLARSHCVSADNSHALHPNHLDRHHLEHAPVLNGGIAIKTNVNQRYATSVESIAPILTAFDKAGIKPQWFSSKNTVPCGSTIGPLTATQLGIDTVDIGVPQLSMHSIREVCGSADPLSLAGLLRAYWDR